MRRVWKHSRRYTKIAYHTCNRIYLDYAYDISVSPMHVKIDRADTCAYTHLARSNISASGASSSTPGKARQGIQQQPQTARNTEHMLIQISGYDPSI